MYRESSARPFNRQDQIISAYKNVGPRQRMIDKPSTSSAALYETKEGGNEGQRWVEGGREGDVN